MCRYLEVGSGFVAAYHLVVLAVLRAILLTSRGHNPPSPKQTAACVAALWAIALLAATPFMLTVEDHHGFCSYTEGTDIERDVWLLNSFSCFVPVLLILGLYLLAHLVGKRYFQDSYSYREKQMSKLVTVIVAVFVVCQVPFRALDLHVYYKESEAEGEEFVDVQSIESLYIARNYLLCLMMADKAARPIIYSKLAPELAEAFDEVINCTMCSRAYTQGRIRNGESLVRSGGGVGGGGGGGGGCCGSGGGGNNNNNGGGSSSYPGTPKANGHSVRNPSTSSSAPLTAGWEGTGVEDPPDRDTARDEEMEVVQL